MVVAVASAGLLFRLGVYFNMQLETAKLMSGIVAGSKVVELSSKESKNIYYLPHNVSFIAVSGVGEEKNGIEKGKALNNYGKILNNVVDVVNRCRKLYYQDKITINFLIMVCLFTSGMV